jgi:polyisoprenoid-binding protein YceI
MKKLSFIIALALFALAGNAQKRTTTSAVVTFDATTPIDELPKAENKTVIAAFDPTTGTIAFEAAIRNFSFSNAMMQDHFNGKKWLNSEQFPTAIFKGIVSNISKLDLTKDGNYTADVEGDLTIHGATKPVKTTATIVVANKAITANAAFSIKLEDFNVTGGAISAGKIAPEPKIIVNASW